MSKVTAGAVARTIVLLVALLNQILAMSGKQAVSIADNDIYQPIIHNWRVCLGLVEEQ